MALRTFLILLLKKFRKWCMASAQGLEELVKGFIPL